MSAHRGPPPHKGAHDGAGPVDAPPRSAPNAVPKMGVRARIAEWPPKRDPAPPAAAAAGAPSPDPARGRPSGLAAAQRRSKDAEFPEPRPLGAPRRPPAQLRHRSSSEVTLSECEPEEGGEAGPGGGRAGGAGGGAAGGGGLFREYGSTSSIDAQGVSEQSFVAVLNELRGAAAGGGAARGAGPDGGGPGPGREEAAAQPKEKARRKGGNGAGESIFRKLRGRGDGDGGGGGGGGEEAGKAWRCRRSFAHFDVQSLLFDPDAVAASRAAAAPRRNTTTGASAASVPLPEERGGRDGAGGGAAGGEGGGELLLSCPHFCNEVGGGGGERDLSFSCAAAGGRRGGDGEPWGDGRPSNAGVAVLEAGGEPRRSPGGAKRHSVEHADLGARYYRDFFHGKGGRRARWRPGGGGGEGG